MVLGIIGKVGSGKTFCTEYLQNEYGAIAFSCDAIAKEIISNNKTDYIPLPPNIFFRSEEAQKECREKIHPLVYNIIKKGIEEIYSSSLSSDTNDIEKLIVVECALPSVPLFDICDKILYVKNSYENKVRILKEKRGYDEETTKMIFDSQSFYDKYYDMADFTIENDGTKIDLEMKLKEVMNEIYIVRK